ncbi:MAG TPA: hypothetical protein VN229_10790, partial [Terriglobales bacterium]|nr:hypothetical protein [Terriglobales bacterium]
GVFSDQWLEPIARVLSNLGTEHAWVVHGSDGLDEITITGPTEICELKNGELRRFRLSPAELGLPLGTAAEIRGGEPEQNAAALRELLDGKTGAYRNIVLMNAAGALVVAGAAPDFTTGAKMAAESIDFGHARAKLEQLIAVTNAAQVAS